MTLVEFLDAVKRGSRRRQVLAVLYWYEHYRDRDSLSATEIKAALVQARIPNARNVNVPQVLSTSGPLVNSEANDERGHKRWQLTETGRREVRASHGLPDEQPEIAHSAGDLQELSSKLTDPSTREYVEEAILCLSVGALRAAIVFMWVAGVREVQNRVWAHGASAVNGAAQRHNPKVKVMKKRDDLSEIKEVELLQVAQDLGELDKSQKQILDHCLTTRNQCGHPNKYNPGVAKAKAHIEDITSILFL